MANHNPPSNPFKKDNKNSQFITATGRPKIFENPQQLWLAACTYFTYSTDTPVHCWVFDRGRLVSEYKVQAMSARGLCLFLGVNKKTLSVYKKDPVFTDTVNRINDVMFVHNFKHAAIGLLHGKIIAYDGVYA